VRPLLHDEPRALVRDIFEIHQEPDLGPRLPPTPARLLHARVALQRVEQAP
jgi:hypothetical protein